MTVTIMQSGRTFDAARPHTRMVFFRDIGAHLSKICKFNGATDAFYSCAQHGTIVAKEMSKVDGPLGALYGLLHNAHRAIICSDELTKANVSRVIHEALDLDWPPPAQTMRAMTQVHARVDLAEKHQLMTGWTKQTERAMSDGVFPLRSTIRPVPWHLANDQWFALLQTNSAASNIVHLPSLGEVE